MKKDFGNVLFLICLIYSFLSAPFLITSASSQEKAEEWELVFFNPDSASQNPVDATNALQTFANVLNKRENWNLRAYFFKKQKDLDNFLDTHKVEFGILSQLYLVENYTKRNLVPFCAPLRNGKTTYRKVILVTKESGYQDLQDLKGKTLAATALGEENVPFYNKVVFRGEIDVTTHFKEIKTVDSANSAIMAVLYGQVDAATVTLSSFVIMQDLNPQVKAKLTSIFTSAETPISPMCYFKDNADQTVIPKLLKILLALHDDPIGRQSMLAFQVEAWEPTNIEAFRETEQIVKGSGTTTAAVTTAAATTVQTAKLPVGEPTPPPVKVPEIYRTQVYKSDDGKNLVFKAWLRNFEEGIKRDSVSLAVSINNQAQSTYAMALTDNAQAEVRVPFTSSTPSDQVKEIEYSVVSGDTLGKIAQKFLGTSKKYNVIATLNNISNPNVIYIGQKLRIKTGEAEVFEIRYRITARGLENQEITSREKTDFLY